MKGLYQEAGDEVKFLMNLEINVKKKNVSGQ